MKKFLFCLGLMSALMLAPLHSSAFEASDSKETKALLGKIVSTLVPSEENEAWLRELFSHDDDGVKTSAKLRLAALYWQSGRFELAQEILDDLSANYESYSPKYKIESLLTWATFELRRNNYIEAESYIRRAVDVAERSHRALIGNTYYMLGYSLHEQGKTFHAQRAYEKAITEYEARNNNTGLTISLNALGMMLSNTGDFENGIKHLLRARELVEKHTSPSYKASVNHNLGDVFLGSGEPEKALIYYKKALELNADMDDFGDLANDHSAIANAYIDMENFTSALQHNQQAIQYLYKISAPKQLSRTLLQQAKIRSALKDDEGRHESLLLAQRSAEASESPFQEMSVNVALGEYWLDEGHADKARGVLVLALATAEELENTKRLITIHKFLANAYSRLNDFKQAYSHSNKSYALQTTLNNEDQREKTERYKRDVNLLEEQLKVSALQKKEAEQAQAIEQQNIIRQRLIVFLVGIAIVFVALVLLLVQRRKLALLRAKLFEEALEQKQKLFADVSHELRTPLTSLKLQIQALQFDLVSNVEDSYEKLGNKVNEINRLIADIYQLALADTNSLELNRTEVSLAAQFIVWKSDWQQFVESSGFSWCCQFALGDSHKSIDQERIKQVIDNLLSNAVAYTDKPGCISMNAFIQHEKLVVSIEDTAPTVSEDKLELIFNRLYRVESSRSRKTGGSGLGLAICEGIIKAHGGTIKAKQSKLGGLKVTFKI